MKESAEPVVEEETETAESEEETDNDTESESDSESNELEKNTKRIYIINEKKIPLPKNKYGDLPIILRNFLQFDTFGCKSKEEPNILKYK